MLIPFICNAALDLMMHLKDGAVGGPSEGEDVDGDEEEVRGRGASVVHGRAACACRCTARVRVHAVSGVTVPDPTDPQDETHVRLVGPLTARMRTVTRRGRCAAVGQVSCTVE